MPMHLFTVRSLAFAATLCLGTAGSSVLGAQETRCEVLDPELQGSYEGGCLNGLAEGEGTAKGTAFYKGSFRAGKKHGFGEKNWPNQDSYAGNFVDDLRDGTGSYTWGSGKWAGQRYDGRYRADKRHGRGIYTWPSEDRYDGRWENDFMIDPPPPMLQQYSRALRAATTAIGKPGTHVCKWMPVGLAERERIEGDVIKVIDDEIEVSVTTVDKYSPAAPSPSKRLQTNILGWYPCSKSSRAAP